MKRTAHVYLRNDSTELQFEWLDFDGDDCFSDFHLNVITKGGTRRFDFGECVVHGLRKFIRFFRNEAQSKVGGGFRNPDIRCYDLHREKDGYRLVIHLEASRLCEEFYVHNPSMEIDDEFMRTVYLG
jgi:hypothetical protein